MLYVGNLCEFLCKVMIQPQAGVFFPQNKELVNTSEMVRKIAVASGHKIWVTSLLTPFVAMGMKMPGKIGNLCQKAFGSSFYEPEMSACGFEYAIYKLDDTIKLTEAE